MHDQSMVSDWPAALPQQSGGAEVIAGCAQVVHAGCSGQRTQGQHRDWQISALEYRGMRQDGRSLCWLWAGSQMCNYAPDSRQGVCKVQVITVEKKRDSHEVLTVRHVSIIGIHS